MPTKIRGISEVVLWVHDMHMALSFYRGVLGLTVISPSSMNDPIYLEAGGPPSGIPQMIVLMQLPPESREFSTPRQLKHLSFEISAQDFDREMERLKDLGFDPQRGRHLVVPARTICIKDPDGNQIELICKRNG